MADPARGPVQGGTFHGREAGKASCNPTRASAGDNTSSYPYRCCPFRTMGTILTRRTGRPQGEAVQAPCTGDQRRGTQLWGRSSARPSGHPSETSGSIYWRLLATREGQSGPLNGVLGDNSYAAWSQKTKEVRKVPRVPLRRQSGQHPIPAEARGGGRSAPGLPTTGKGRLTCRRSHFCTLLSPGPSSEAVPHPKCPDRGSSALLPGAHPPGASTLSFVLELLALPPPFSLLFPLRDQLLQGRQAGSCPLLCPHPPGSSH